MSISAARCLARSFDSISRDRHRAESRIADVARHVGIGELLGFDHDVQRGGGVVAVILEREILHDVEHGERGDALAVGRQLVDLPAAIGGGDRLDPFGLELREVLERVGAALGLEELHQVSRSCLPL